MADQKNELTVDQGVYVVPDFPIKDLLGTIPSHCFKRSAIKSSMYIVWDALVIAAIYHAAIYADAWISTPEVMTSLPHPALYPAAKFAIWALYTFWTGLFATGLWVIAHECGHQAFSESKFINNSVGWVLHSGLGVPYHSWRITHAKHHASTGHMTQDQVFVPRTRSYLGLPPLDETREDKFGSRISAELSKEFWDAIGESPIGSALGAASYLIIGWPMYLMRNASGQKHYPAGTNHYNPSAVMFGPHQYRQILVSDVGIMLWLGAIGVSINQWGFWNVFILYLIPYLWVNHWLVLITFLQHTDPILPHYRGPQFNFTRGALCTLDRSLLGDLGSVMGWIGAHATHGISETHILHHLSSKIPHYNAWEASAALKKLLEANGVQTEGRPGGWAEIYRVYRECKFVEDEGDVIFYKNAKGLAQMRPVFNDNTASDSGIEVEK